MNDFIFKSDFTDPTQVYMKLTSYLTSFRKLVRDTIGAYLLKKWKQIEKKNIVSVDKTMLQEILRIQAETFDNKSQESLIKYSEKFIEVFYVIKNKEEIAGYCTYYLKPELSLKGLKKKSVIYSIAVDKKFRGKGYGRKLIEESMKEMKLNGIYSILLYVNVNNTPAIKLYEKIGFRTIKETKDVCGQNEMCYTKELKLF
jgi:ribosomal-protein-alanine N-acetyltransferase